MSYEKPTNPNGLPKIASAPSAGTKRRGAVIRAARRIKPGPAYYQGMREWSERIVRELWAET